MTLGSGRLPLSGDPYEGAAIQIDMNRLSGGLTLRVGEEEITLTPEELLLAFRMIKRVSSREPTGVDTIPRTSWLPR